LSAPGRPMIPAPTTPFAKVMAVNTSDVLPFRGDAILAEEFSSSKLSLLPARRDKEGEIRRELSEDDVDNIFDDF
jgi:hypothetical protein